MDKTKLSDRLNSQGCRFFGKNPKPDSEMTESKKEFFVSMINSKKGL